MLFSNDSICFLQENHSNHVMQIKAKLTKAKYVSLTSDLWSRDTRSFLALNAYWINEGGKLETVLLACERFTGRHSADNIAAKIKAIINRYGISSKVMAITTDNASNFKCCFERHGDNYETMKNLMNNVLDDDDQAFFHCDIDDLDNMWCPTDELLTSACDFVPCSKSKTGESSEADNDDCDAEQNDNFRIQEIPNEMNQHIIGDMNSQAFLLNKIDCSAHTLNLIGKVDAFDALDGHNKYSDQYVSAFSKLNEIWRKNSTRTGRETFQRYLPDKVILKPHRIRWNRVYDAVSTEFAVVTNQN